MLRHISFPVRNAKQAIMLALQIPANVKELHFIKHTNKSRAQQIEQFVASQKRKNP